MKEFTDYKSWEKAAKEAGLKIDNGIEDCTIGPQADDMYQPISAINCNGYPNGNFTFITEDGKPYGFLVDNYYEYENYYRS